MCGERRGCGECVCVARGCGECVCVVRGGDVECVCVVRGGGVEGVCLYFSEDAREWAGIVCVPGIHEKLKDS